MKQNDSSHHHYSCPHSIHRNTLCVESIKRKKTQAIMTDFRCFYSCGQDVCAKSRPTQLDTWTAGLATQSRCFLEENWRGCSIRQCLKTSTGILQVFAVESLLPLKVPSFLTVCCLKAHVCVGRISG